MSKKTLQGTKKPKALLREKLFVPFEHVTPDHLEAWTCLVPDPEAEKPEDMLELQLYRDLGKVYSFCAGDQKKVQKHFGNFNLIDKRAAPPMDHPLTMVSSLFNPETDPNNAGRNQQQVSDEWVAAGYGQIHAPARFGKTVTVTDITCRMGLKTLLLSHQKDLLDQFEKTIRQHTDVADLEKMLGRKLVSRLDKWDWDRLGELEVVLSTWQAWWHPTTRKYLKKYRDAFGLVLTDESHLSSPPCYSRVINSFSAKHKGGNTATPIKVSELHVIIENVIGPVVTTGHSQQMHCEVYYVHTDSKVKNTKQWTTMISRLTKLKKRNRLIVEQAVADANAGRHILITTERLEHANRLATLINAYGIPALAVTGNTGERDALWERARKGEVKVVVAMRRITRLGIDVPLWDTFYNVLPTADPFNYYQELSRIRTNYKGKPTPIIRDFIDDPEKEITGAIIGTMNARNQVYQEQGFTIQNAGFKARKPPSLKWGRKLKTSNEG